MPAASPAADSDRSATLIQFGKARARLLKKLTRLDEEVGAFCSDVGERASLDIVRQLMPDAIARIEASKGRPIDNQVCRDLARAMEALAPAFDATIAEDVAAEARESEAAAKLRDRYFEASETYDRFVEFTESVGDSLEDGEDDMSDPFQPTATPFGGEWSTPTAPGRAGVRYLSVADQLAASLNELGLPHENGSLQIEGKRDQVAENLIRALTTGFDISSSSVGMRARRRTRPGWTAASTSRGMLAGRLDIDADAIRVEADGLEMLLDGVESRFHYPLSGGRDRTRRARDAISELLREVRDVVGRPTGLPVQQADARIAKLAKRVEDYFSSFRIHFTPVRPELTGRIAADVVPPDDKDLLPISVTRRERFQAQYEEAMLSVVTISLRIYAAIDKRSAGEVAYHLERAMESAARGIVDIRMRLQSAAMTGAVDRWQAIDIDGVDDSGGRCNTENLADGLDGALAWLQPHTDRFARADFFADDMTDEEAEELGAELQDIAAILLACFAALKPGREDPQFAALVDGLAQVTNKAGCLAVKLSRSKC